MSAVGLIDIDLALGLTVRRRPPLLETVDVNAIYFRFFGWTRECVGNKIRLALHIPNVRRVFGYAGQLVLLTDRLRIRLLMDGRN